MIPYLAIAVFLILVIVVIKSAQRARKVYQAKPSKWCPICVRPYDNTRRPVIYHVSYNPEKVISACQICNEIEYLDRNNLMYSRLKKIHNLRLQ